MEPNTQQGQVQDNLFESASQEDQQYNDLYSQPEVEPETHPEGQEEEEFVEVEGEQIPLKETDNPKSYKFFQTKFTKQQEETVQEREARIRFEQENRILKEQLQNLQNPKPITQAPEKPAPLPPMPSDFNMAEAFDETTPSGQWYKLKLTRDIKVDAYNDYWRTEREQKEQKDAEIQRQQAEFAQFKNEKVSGFQTAGATLQEAMETFDWLTSDESGKPEVILAFRRFVKGNKQIKQPGQRPGQIQSPSAVPSVDEPKPNDGKEFFNSFGTRGQNIFKTG